MNEQVRNLMNENERLREIVSVVEDAVKTHIAWEAGASATFVAWHELVWDLYDMLYGGEEE